jgi:hypothetical protein
MIAQGKKLAWSLLLALLVASALQAESKSDMITNLKLAQKITFPETAHLFTDYVNSAKRTSVPDLFEDWDKYIIVLNKYMRKQCQDLLGRKDDRIMAAYELALKVNNNLVGNLKGAINNLIKNNPTQVRAYVEKIEHNGDREVLRNTVPGLRDLKTRLTLTNKKDAVEVLIYFVLALEECSKRVVNNFKQYKS